jgi:hypothetical protein
VKPSTRAIIILSALLALALGWIVYSTVRGDAALTDAKEEIAAAETRAESAETANVVLEASNAEYKKSNDAQKLIDAEKDRTISAQGKTIAALRKDHADLHGTAGVAIAQGATLKEAFDAGQPIVENIAVPALTEWYGHTEPLIDPLLASLGLFPLQIAAAEARVTELDNQNQALAVLNKEATILHMADGFRINADASTISEQKEDLSGLRLDLSAAGTDIQTALNRAQLGEALAWIFGILTAAGSAYIGAHALGWVK